MGTADVQIEMVSNFINGKWENSSAKDRARDYQSRNR